MGKHYFSKVHSAKNWQKEEAHSKDAFRPLGHFGEHCTIVEICKSYFWHNCVNEVCKVVKACIYCQLVKMIGSEELKNTLVHDLFY
jgi:hypothetical protein